MLMKLLQIAHLRSFMRQCSLRAFSMHLKAFSLSSLTCAVKECGHYWNVLVLPVQACC